jgi:hypothetical protein
MIHQVIDSAGILDSEFTRQAVRVPKSAKVPIVMTPYLLVTQELGPGSLASAMPNLSDGLTIAGNICHIGSVKTVTRNISLSEDLANFAVQEAEEGGYGNVSAYFAELIRQRRQAQIDADVEFLAQAIKDAPPGPEPVERIVAACKAARRKMRKRSWTAQ